MREAGEEAEPKPVAPEAPNEITDRPRKRKADVAIYLNDPDEEEAEMTNKKHCESEVEWSPDAGCASSHSFIPTPDEEEYEPVSLVNDGFPHYNFNNIFATPVRCAPLPILRWASKDMWNNMLEKDKIYIRDVNMMEKHPRLRPKMRGILLDWLMEVSQMYKLQRETYHLAQDYFDRFMATQSDVFKSALQLIGITCLFIATKVEEIHPPKARQLVYLTEDACTENELLNMEIIILNKLNWSLNPQTPISWLNVFMQVAYLKESEKLLTPQFPHATFTQIAKLLDLCMLDVRCLKFCNGILAASALFHFSSLELVENVSAMKKVEVEDCVRWMEPFAMALKEDGMTPMKVIPGIPADELHNIQTHSSYLPLVARACSYLKMKSQNQGPCTVLLGVLTPPLSNEKSEEFLPLDAATQDA